MRSFKHFASIVFLAVATPICLAVPAPAPAPAPSPRPAPSPQLLPPILPPILPTILPTILPNPVPTCASGPVQCCQGLSGLSNLIPVGDLSSITSLLPLGGLSSDAIVAFNCQAATLGLACVSGTPFCCATTVPVPLDLPLPLPLPVPLTGAIGVNCSDAPGLGPILPGLPLN